MLDIGSSNMALKESARTSVAQADRFPVAEAERRQHKGQQGNDLGIHGTDGQQEDPS